MTISLVYIRCYCSIIFPKSNPYTVHFPKTEDFYANTA